MLPTFLVAAAAQIVSKGVTALYLPKDSYQERPLTAVPRDLVFSQFQTAILAQFGKSAHLAKFPGLAEKALSHAASDTERAFFEDQHKEKTMWSEKSTFVVAADDSTIWKNPGVAGHYYLAEYVSRQRMFDNKARQALPALADKIGRLSTSERDDIIARLYH